MSASSSVLAKARDFLKSAPSQTEEQPEKQPYLYGLRGILTILSLLWIFFQTFIPTLVSNETKGPTYQKVLRIVFSPIFWNESLISSFFFALSARSICVNFLKDPKPTTFSGSIIRRIVRMPIAVALASGIASGIFRAIGTDYIHTFKKALPNTSIDVPEVADSGLNVVISMFDIFWVVRSYFYQAANDFWPTRTIWNVSLLYQQSWTVYFLMVILPFTRASWHFEFLALFSLGSFWMCSWGWYDAAALVLADYVVNPKLRTRLEEGLTIRADWDWKIPHAIPAAAMVVLGFAMKFCWTVFPQYTDKELLLHPFLDISENTTRAGFAAADPYPRVDNFLVIFGILLLVETTPQLKDLIGAKWLVALGKRSLSIFIAQSIIFWTAGIKLFLHLHGDLGTNTALANLAVFVTSTIATLTFAELYYRVVDLPSQWIAGATFSWLLR